PHKVNDDILARAFGRYPSFLKAKVIRDKRTGKTKGYGFVSFKDPNDYVRAMREMNGELPGPAGTRGRWGALGSMGSMGSMG
uniref:RRM domain-containing protein n=1 Tax=Phasianus colchicus TaxID=9054 RepID=A0A669QX24_PHACC